MIEINELSCVLYLREDFMKKVRRLLQKIQGVVSEEKEIVGILTHKGYKVIYFIILAQKKILHQRI